MKTIRFAFLAPALWLGLLTSVAPAQENVWTSHGPADGGVVNDVAVGDTVSYAATPNGVFRSSDGARTWQQSGLAGEYISRILARPGAAVVLAITASESLYASRDAGQTWTRIPGLPSVRTAAIDPWHPTTIYAGAGDAIWKSTDSGETFQRQSTTPTGFAALAFAFDSRALYLQCFDVIYESQVYKSQDGGTSWAIVQLPLSRASVFAGGAADGVVYAGARGSLCRSLDSAATWTCSSFPDYPYAVVELAGNAPGVASRVLAVSEDTLSQTTLYVSGGEGATWVPVIALPVGSFSVSSLVSDAAGSLVLAGTSTGTFRSEDRGDSWTPGREGLRSARIASLALDPHNPSTVWASAFDLGLFRSADRGFSWSPAVAPAEARALGALAIDPEHSSTLYVGTNSGVSRSDDDGAHWTSSALPDSAVPNALTIDPVSPSRVWAASYAGLFRSDDGARTWSPASIAQSIYCLLFDEKRRDTMYAGSDFGVLPADFTYPEYPYGGAVFESHNGGESFTKVDHDFGSAVSAIAVDRFRDNTLYVGTSSLGVFRTVNGGTTWESASEGLPVGGPSGALVLGLVADPVQPGRLYCATDRGVFRTIDGAQTWQGFSSGLAASLRVSDLIISPDGRTLHAGTAGGDIFELDLRTEAGDPCVASATRLCLVGNRYAVDLLAARPGEIQSHPGAARPLNDRAGYFGLPFVTGDPDLPEVVVKMLAKGSFGAAGAPFFYSSLTTLPYSLTVTDTVTGEQQLYASNPGALLCGGVDIAFGGEASMSLRGAPASAAGETALPLLGGRFSITLEGRNPLSGQTVSGVPMSSGDRFGFFSLPDLTGDPQFPEVVVKMIDARAIEGNFWFFYTGLTSLDYTLTVTDSVTGATRVYVGTTPFCGGADTHAFTSSLNPVALDWNGFWSGEIAFPAGKQPFDGRTS
jgi:photosystem II stability/assembly factor-like uncharacterized protein